MIKPNFDNKSLTLLLTIVATPSVIVKLLPKARRWGFSAKDEFHLTVIGTKTAKVLKELCEPDVAGRIEKIVSSIDWKYVLKKEIFKIKKNYYSTDPAGEAQKETRESIIQIVDLFGLEEFYRKLNSTFKTKVGLPVPHITLFSKSTDKMKQLRGIGVYSKEDLESLKPGKILLS